MTRTQYDSIKRLLLVLVPVALGLAACESEAPIDDQAIDEEVEGVEMEMGVADLEGQVFAAELSPVNDDLAPGTPAGRAELEIRGDSLVITVDAEGVPPSMMHLQHFHGFADGSEARCPGTEADANGDGVIDVTETAAAAGTTMVPFHGDPTSMEIQAESYPWADAAGQYGYQKAVHLDTLGAAFQETFETRDLDLADRVVFIHGVPADVELPASVASVMDVPARVTLPIACGELEAAAAEAE